MKGFKKVLYGFLALLMIFSGFIALCAAKPELSEQIAGALHIGEEEQADGGSGEVDAVGQAADQIGQAQLFSTQPVEKEVQTEDGSQSEQSAVAGENQTQPVNWQQPPVEYDDEAISGISVPEAVSGKNGYQPIQENSSQIDEDEAKRLEEEVGVGQTGDNLTFDARFYPFYAMLNEQGQHMYRQIYANVSDLQEEFRPVENVSVKELHDVFEAVYNDHPELFWVDTAYSCKYTSDGKCAAIRLQFNSTAQNLEKEKTSFEEKAKVITDGAQELGSDYEKEKYVHDALISKVDYVASAKMNQSAYSALVNGRTVCAGYARAFQYMMQQLGIPCYYCTGYAGENHAWNIISLENEFYNVDATWDDTGAGTYDYFNKSDADYMGTHLREDLSVNLPPCNGEKYRNLENASGTGNSTGEAGETEKRSLADVGIAQESVLTTLQDYYNDCYEKIVQTGKGSYNFQNAIAGEALKSEVYSAYQSNGCNQGYMDKVLSQLGASYCNVNGTFEELQDGYYLITHKVSVR